MLVTCLFPPKGPFSPRCLAARCRHLLAVLLLAGLAATPLRAGETGFLAGIEDLPIMPGLEELTDQGLVFDKPEGRIVEAFAEGDLAADDVAVFYRRTLPELGWQAESEGLYRREGEVLSIEVQGTHNGGVLVAFRLAPR